MKNFLILAAGLALAGVGAAEDAAVKAKPLPRPKIDPTTKAAVVVPMSDAAASNATSPPVTMMDRFVIKDQSLVEFLYRRRYGPDATEKFSIENGIKKGDRVKVGLWTHYDVMEDDAHYRSTKHQGFGLLQFKL